MTSTLQLGEGVEQRLTERGGRKAYSHLADIMTVTRCEGTQETKFRQSLKTKMLGICD